MRMISSLPALAAGALLLVGCGGPAAPTTTQPPATTQAPAAPTESAAPSTQAPANGTDSAVQDFIDKVSAAKMTTYTMDMAMTTQVEGTSLELSTSGTFDNTDPANPASHLKMKVSGMDMEMISVGGDYFMKMAMTGDQWIKMDAASAQEMTGSAAPDFTTWAETTKDAIEGVEVVGEESIGGVTATHYRLTMTPAAVADLGVEETGLEGATFGYDVWVDAEGFTRKFDVSVTGGSIPMEMTSTLDNFNKPVDIKAPKNWVESPS